MPLPKQLPAELIDFIFSILREEGDISALQACSKAHAPYSRLAERHIYTDIKLWIYEPQPIYEVHDQLSKNSHLLNYIRTLEITGNVPLYVYPPTLPIISMIPQMINLKSLNLYGYSCSHDQVEEFISSLRDSIQQSSIENLCLRQITDFPLSILDANKTIKSLTLVDCWAEKESKPDVLTSPSVQQSFESLVISGMYNVDILLWTTPRVTRLKSLELRDLSLRESHDWTPLLMACSNSLTSLHLYDDGDFAFSLSAHTCLKKISIFTQTSLFPDEDDDDEIEVRTSLPEIIPLIITAPSIQHVILSVYFMVLDISSVGQFDWSPLHLLQSDFPGTQPPRIELYVNGEGLNFSIPDESILEAVAGNEVMMDLVNRDVVTLKSGCTDQPM